MPKEQVVVVGIVRLGVCFQPSPFAELFGLWLGLHYFVFKIGIVFRTGQNFKHFLDVLCENGNFSDKG